MLTFKYFFMKNLKISLFTLFVAAIATIGMSFKSIDAPVSKKFTTVDYKWINATDFTLATSSSTLLNVTGNWGTGTTSISGTTKMEYVNAVYSSPVTKQEVLDAVRAEFELLASSIPSATFTDAYNFNATVRGINVSITVFLKS